MGVEHESKKELNVGAWPLDGLERISTCPVCGGRERRKVYSDLTDRVFRCAPGKWDLFECGECKSSYIDPRPTQSTIGLAYASYYTHTKDLVAKKEKLNFFEWCKRSVANGYRNYKFGTRFRPAFPFGFLVSRLASSYTAKIDAEFRHIPKAEEGGRILDVGCGDGKFLANAKQAGWDVVGVEPDPKAVIAARKKNIIVHEGMLNATEFEPESFDGITVRHVIEHIHEPVEILRHCHRLLKPGGWIWLETPNIEGIGHQLYGRNWRDLDPPRHLVLFTRSSIIRALKESGFETIQDQPYRPLCKGIFASSEAIARGEDFSVTDPWLEIVKGKAKKAEKKAIKEPRLREFIVVKASKSSGN